MKKNFLLGCFSLISTLAMAQPPNVPADKGAQFGTRFNVGTIVTPEQLPVLLEKGKADVQLKAEVVEVCQKEGCWLKVQSSNGGKIMVKMIDHEFLVPTAINGKTIVINGNAETKETSVAQLRHYAEDAGKSKAEIEAIKEPKKEIIVQAKGITVL